MDRGRFKDYSSKSRRDWTDWLSDSPPSASAKQALRQSRVDSAAAYQPRFAQPAAAVSPTSATKPDLTININLQKLKLPKPKLPKIAWVKLLPSKRLALAMSVVAVAVVTVFVLTRGPRNSTTESDSGITRSSPSFKTVAPVTKPQLGNFAGRVTAYDGRRDIYSYADSLNGNRITISEQSIPQKLGPTDQAVRKVAAQVGAGSKISTKNGDAYIRTDPETGAQIVVCSVKGVLLFINSSTSFQDATWAEYIGNLQ